MQETRSVDLADPVAQAVAHGLGFRDAGRERGRKTLIHVAWPFREVVAAAVADVAAGQKVYEYQDGFSCREPALLVPYLKDHGT